MGDQKRRAGRQEKKTPQTSAAAKKDAEVEDITNLEEELAEARTEAAEHLDLLKRVKAEFDNYKKRIIREQTQFIESASRNLVRALVPLLDDLERALEAGHDAQKREDLGTGVEMIYKQMQEILAKEGLGEIDPEGEKFDPEYHEAVLALEEHGVPENTVTEVFRKGYQFKGRVLRPATVKVARRPSGEMTAKPSKEAETGRGEKQQE